MHGARPPFLPTRRNATLTCSAKTRVHASYVVPAALQSANQSPVLGYLFAGVVLGQLGWVLHC